MFIKVYLSYIFWFLIVLLERYLMNIDINSARFRWLNLLFVAGGGEQSVRDGPPANFLSMRLGQTRTHHEVCETCGIIQMRDIMRAMKKLKNSFIGRELGFSEVTKSPS